MKLQKLISILEQKPGYLKSGPASVSKKFNVSLQTATAAIRAVKIALKKVDTSRATSLIKLEMSNENSNTITEFEEYIKNNGIDPANINSVKYWQNMKGEQRFSVVTKSERNADDIKKEIEEFAAYYSPTTYIGIHSYHNSTKSKWGHIAYEISLPDIHYGKLTDMSVEAMETQFLETIQDLMDKAQGLNIQKIILPIGNDGMNSEGMRMATTKGTPQQDTLHWRSTFRGYWQLIVKAVDYLKQYAPVQIIVVPGNHDFERMFYAGDVLAGWYRNDDNVTVDNTPASRKYFEYGKNMILYTHGDKEKFADLPLIMATEQPEMFARCQYREAHVGHFHKEQVNEFRGVKVRVVPSICASDDWHKMMGYESLRAAQGFIYNYDEGLDGYLQSNVK